MGSSPLFLPYAYAIAIADKIPVKLNTELDTALNQSGNCGPHNLIQNSDQPGIGKLPISKNIEVTMIKGVIIKKPSRNDIKTTLFPSFEATGISTFSNFFCILKPPTEKLIAATSLKS